MYQVDMIIKFTTKNAWQMPSIENLPEVPGKKNIIRCRQICKGLSVLLKLSTLDCDGQYSKYMHCLNRIGISFQIKVCVKISLLSLDVSNSSF